MRFVNALDKNWHNFISFEIVLRNAPKFQIKHLKVLNIAPTSFDLQFNIHENLEIKHIFFYLNILRI